MWKKGELVWVSSTLSDTWIPGRIQDPSGVLVSFFGSMEPRYVPKPCIRSFHRDFGTLVSDSWRFRKSVNRALRAHFWNISFGLWCSCQSPIDSPYLDRQNSLPWFPPTSNSALAFVRDMAISLRMLPLRRLAETNSASAQILSFRRYIVHFKRSESVYREIRESAKLMDQSQEPGWCLDPLNEIGCINGDPSPKDIHCYVSPSSEKPVDKVIQVCTGNRRNPLTTSDSCIMKACKTVAPIVHHEDDGHFSKRIKSCQHEHHIIGSDDTTVKSAEHGAGNNKAILAKPVFFAVSGACKTLACSVKETYANSRNKLNSTMDGESLENKNFDALEEVGQVSLHVTSTSVKKLSCHDEFITSAKQSQSQGLDTTVGIAIAVENQTEPVDNIRSIGVKRKANGDKLSAGNSKRKKKAGQQSISTDKPLNLHLLKDMRHAKPKCLRMKFLSRHGNLPSKAELLKRFSVFGKIDASRTDINPEKSSAKVVFLQSIDAVTAYQFARSKKFTLGRSKVMFQLDPFEQDGEINEAPMSQKPQKSVPSPTSCLKKHDKLDEEKERRNLKVNFRMESTDS